MGRLKMPQFAVYRNANPETNDTFPLLVDVQADVLEDLRTRAVIPLASAVELTGFPMIYLTPLVPFEGKAYMLMTPQLAGISRAELGPQAGSLAAQERVITNAIDFLIRGF
jgi:toxin CcdB